MIDDGPTRVGLAALTIATRYVGTMEQPPGSNRGPLIDKWNKAAHVALGSPYCDSFQNSVWAEAGVKLGKGWENGSAYCPATLAWGQKQGWERRRPWKGFLVFFDWDQDGVVDHVGIVAGVSALRWQGIKANRRFVGLIRTIEANTSPGLTGSQSDGGGVYRRTRWVNSSTRFLRVPDTAVKTP